MTRKLRALWALHVTAGLTENDCWRSSARQRIPPQLGRYLLVDGKNRQMRRCANSRGWHEDPSPLVRLYLASARSASRRKRWDVLAGLLAHGDDATDQNLPLMVWYAAEPVVALDMARALGAAFDSKLPRLLAFTVQRIAAIGTQEALRVLTDRLGRTEDAAQQRELLSGISKIVNKG